MSFEMISWAKLDFKFFYPAVIPSEGSTLGTSRALLRHKKFDFWTKISKIEKDNDWVGGPSGSLRMSFEVII